MKKLFVGGLSWEITDEGLSDAFGKFGKVSEAKIILERETGRSRGFGFVSFDDNDAADEALEGMNGTELNGRTLAVNEAHEGQQRKNNTNRNNRGGDNRMSRDRF